MKIQCSSYSVQFPFIQLLYDLLPLLQGSENQEDQEANNNISEMEDGLAPSPPGASSSDSPKEVRLMCHWRSNEIRPGDMVE